MKENVILHVANIRKAFGSLVALDDVSVDIRKGTITSIIGLNGAGKTTLFNVVTGALKPDGGRLVFEGKDITGLPPHKIVKLGITRTFQITNVFPELSVYENVLTAFQVSRGIALSVLFSQVKEVREVMDTLQVLDLREKKELLASQLSYGEQRRLETGIAMATNPKLLLMDEPTGGMTPLEAAQTMDYVKKIRDSLGITVVFIEHDMDVVMQHSDRILLLQKGKVICEGKPEEVSANQQCREIYLGTRE